MKLKKVYLSAITLFIFLFVGVQTTHALTFGDIVDGIKDFFTPDPPKELTIDSKIELAPGGDVDKNGQIDAGDIVRFTYELKNTTDTEYSFATLKTNIDRKQLNFIHNIYGTASLGDDGKTITIPNFRIGAGQIATLHFDARINYFTDKDISIATEPEFMDKDKKSIKKATKKEIGAKKIAKEKIPGMMKQGISNR